MLIVQAQIVLAKGLKAVGTVAWQRHGQSVDGDAGACQPVAYRRDRRKDQVLQENGYLVLRFLAEDVGRELDAVLDAILRALSSRQLTAPPVAPLSFVRRSRT